MGNKMSKPAHNGVINSYTCLCGAQWGDEWDCEVDDDCPECGTTCSPETSEIIAPCDNEGCSA